MIVLGLPALETIASIDVGQAALPLDLDLNQDGTELAVALSGAGNIALIDPATLKVTGKLLPRNEYGQARPASVVYIKPGRLYAVGGDGWDPIHVFDTATRSEIGRSQHPDTYDGAPRMVLSADGALYVGQSSLSPQQIYRVAANDTAPVGVAKGPHGPVNVPDLAVRRDGSAVYTAGGQVWSSNLQSQLGAFVAKGTRIEYVPATERLFVCQEAGLAEVEADGLYNVVRTYAVSAQPRVARANAAGKTIYVSTDAGIDVIQAGAGASVPPSPFPAPTATLAPPPTRAASGNPTASTPQHIPAKPGVPAFFDFALDEGQGRLYGTDRAAGKLIVLSLPSLDRVAAIDLGQASQPTGVALDRGGTEIAVALMGAGNIALIDPNTLAITGRLYPTVTSGASLPWDVRYGPEGRLYSTGNPDSSGIDYIHVFDTKSRAEIAKSRDIVRSAPRMTFTDDGSLFVSESSGSPQQIYRFALDGETPTQVARGPHGPVSTVDLVARRDGSAVYTAGGQVWSSNLQSLLGTFSAKGTRIEYVWMTERLYICQESAVVEVEATGNYNIVATHGVGTTARVARANTAGTLLYVSTDAGMDVIALNAPAVSSAQPR